MRWTKPNPIAEQAARGDLIALKQFKKEEIRDACERAIKGPLETSLGFAVDFKMEDQIMWSSGIAMAEAAGESAMTIRDFDNLLHEDVPLDDVKAVAERQKQAYMQAYERKWQLQKAIDEAGTVDEVRAIRWEIVL